MSPSGSENSTISNFLKFNVQYMEALPFQRSTDTTQYGTDNSWCKCYQVQEILKQKYEG